MLDDDSIIQPPRRTFTGGLGNRYEKKREPTQFDLERLREAAERRQGRADKKARQQQKSHV